MEGGRVLKSLSSEFGALNLLNVELRIPCMHFMSMCCKLMFSRGKTSIYNTCLINARPTILKHVL